MIFFNCFLMFKVLRFICVVSAFDVFILPMERKKRNVKLFIFPLFFLPFRKTVSGSLYFFALTCNFVPCLPGAVDFSRRFRHDKGEELIDMIALSLENRGGNVLAAASGKASCSLIYEAAYQEGDIIRIQASEAGLLLLGLDDALPPALAYLQTGSAAYAIPFGVERSLLSPRAFTSPRHCLSARLPEAGEGKARRCLTRNPWAAHEPNGLFPFASANVETRGKAVFAARNTIDGLLENHGHGKWPYTSWGINRDPAAALRIDFGRPVKADEAVLYLRADFPHDAWWREGTLHFSDGSALTIPLAKTDAGQHFPFPERVIEWVVLDTLIKADDPSPFPALTQLEIWGREV